MKTEKLYHRHRVSLTETGAKVETPWGYNYRLYTDGKWTYYTEESDASVDVVLICITDSEEYAIKKFNEYMSDLIAEVED